MSNKELDPGTNGLLSQLRDAGDDAQTLRESLMDACDRRVAQLADAAIEYHVFGSTRGTRRDQERSEIQRLLSVKKALWNWKRPVDRVAR